MDFRGGIQGISIQIDLIIEQLLCSPCSPSLLLLNELSIKSNSVLGAGLKFKGCAKKVDAIDHNAIANVKGIGLRLTPNGAGRRTAARRPKIEFLGGRIEEPFAFGIDNVSNRIQ